MNERSMIRVLFSLYFAGCFLALSAQEDKEARALFRKKVTEGSYHLLDENYPEAQRSFLEAYALDSSTSNIHFRLGFCYFKLGTDNKKAVFHLEVASQNISKNYDEFNAKEVKAPVISYYYLALAYHREYRFEEAVTFYDRFLSEIGTRNKELTAEVMRNRDISLNGAELVKKPVEIVLSNLGERINTPFAEYSPVISLDESTLIFTSRRDNSTGGNKDFDGRYFEDIFVSYKGKDGEWSTPASIGPAINTPGHEATIGLSPDGQQLLIYRDDGGDGNIYSSKLEGDTWSAPVKLGSDINTPAWEPSATLSADGNALYFVSDRSGGLGGKDIWRCVKLPDGKWSLAMNLGPAVNTPFDEDAPFMHPDGVTLFFSSEGHRTMGGYDVFYVKRDEETNAWGPSQNIGYPINTTEDDVFYVLSADGKRSYYSSAKAGGKGEKDIYMITLPGEIVDPVLVLKGSILLNDSNHLPPNMRIVVTDLESGEVSQLYRPNSKTGKYLMALSTGKSGKSYHVSYEADGYSPIQDTIRVDKYNVMEREIDLKPVNFGSTGDQDVIVKGTIKSKTAIPLSHSKVVVKENKTGNLAGIYHSTPGTGEYSFKLEKGKDYNLSYEADGYLFQSENISLSRSDPNKEVVKDVLLEELKKGASIVLNNIFFDHNKATLRPSSKVELGKLFKLMKNNPDIRIEISGHTDSKGKDEFNQKLSEARAQSVVNYLIKKGISSDRLSAKGYGETMPVSGETLPNGKPDPKGMQKNRRVEMKIL